jgi:undecaprenyl-diphosphatase
MTWLEAVILGIIQGLTEFLPISSSGHLVLAQHFMDINERGVFLEVILHMGTLIAILVYYWDDLSNLAKDVFNSVAKARTYVLYLAVATVPAVFAGIFFENHIESAFIPSVVIWMLMITGLVVGSTYFVKNRSRREFTYMIVLYIGIAQAFALFPGISRSGITISVALLMGIKHHEAAKFSFFMAIPALLGASLIQMIKIDNLQQIALFPLIMGLLTAAVTGYLVINWLLAVISKGKFYLFSLYCITIAIIAYIVIN